MHVIYDRSAFKFEIKRLADILSETKKLKSKLEGKSLQITSLCQGSLDMISELRKLEKAKEDTRIFYDYYRNKMPKLQSNVGQAPKKQERYEKNVEKQDAANKAYGKACNELHSYILRVESRQDIVLEQLCMRFTRDIEAEFFVQLNHLSQRLGDVEQAMRDVVVNTNSGSFGHLSNNLDLNVDF